MDQGIDFSDVKHLHEMHAYVPQIREATFSYPLLACDLQDFDEELIGWKDPFRGHAAHNLANDAYSIMGGKPLQPVFSIIKLWKPGSERNPADLPTCGSVY